MTPKFTTPCYVRVEDADKRKEVCEELERIGYKNTWHSPLKNQIIVANTSGTYVDVLSVDNTDMINCGTNTELFLALASIRSDTDKGQRFTDGEHWYIMNENKKGDDAYLIDGHLCHRATATEITNYHKQKGE